MPETNLEILLSSINPKLSGRTFVFCTVSEKKLEALAFKPICVFREDEGVTLILEQQHAESAQLEYSGKWSLITCKVNSSLAAVGFLAAMSKVLADDGIPCNAVSAYYHDHLFVPADRAQDAMQILKKLSAASGR